MEEKLFKMSTLVKKNPRSAPADETTWIFRLGIYDTLLQHEHLEMVRILIGVRPFLVPEWAPISIVHYQIEKSCLNHFVFDVLRPW